MAGADGGELIFLFVFSCKKEDNSNSNINGTSVDTLLFGLWENEVAIDIKYDSLNNINSKDTVTFVNSGGDPVKYFENYKNPSQFKIIINLTLKNHIPCSYEL